MDTKCIASIGEIVRVRAVKKAAHSAQRGKRRARSRLARLALRAGTKETISAHLSASRRLKSLFRESRPSFGSIRYAERALNNASSRVRGAFEESNGQHYANGMSTRG